MTRRAANIALALFAGSLLVVAGAGHAFAQYTGNRILRQPAVSTPQPRQAPPPPRIWTPAPALPPAVRQNNPLPQCVTAPCPAPPIIRRP